MLVDRSGYNRDKVAQSKQAPKLKLFHKIPGLFFVTLFFGYASSFFFHFFVTLFFGHKLDNKSKYLAATIKHAHKVLMSSL
jgi:hypothetical protein